MLRTRQALRAGIHPRDLYALRDSGALESVSRGVYRLASLPPLALPDLVTVAARVPRAIVAGVSALHFHGLAAEIPHSVSIALPRGAARPHLSWPPLTIYRFSGPMLAEGIQSHGRDGVAIRVYGPAKAVVDAFRLRNRLGVDVAIDALRTGLDERKFTPAELMATAKRCRAAGVVRPYLEALVAGSLRNT